MDRGRPSSRASTAAGTGPDGRAMACRTASAWRAAGTPLPPASGRAATPDRSKRLGSRTDLRPEPWPSPCARCAIEAWSCRSSRCSRCRWGPVRSPRRTSCGSPGTARASVWPTSALAEIARSRRGRRGARRGRHPALRRVHRLRRPRHQAHPGGRCARSCSAAWSARTPPAAAPEVEREVVRALMLLRLSTLATGRTGVRVETARAYAAVLDAGITPVVHEYGSLGCSGDLAPLSHVRAGPDGGGRRCATPPASLRPAAEALRAAGARPGRAGREGGPGAGQRHRRHARHAGAGPGRPASAARRPPTSPPR